VDRSLYIRIAAVGGPAAAAQIRAVGRAVRETGNASRLASSMVGRDMGRMSSSIRSGFRNVPAQTKMAGQALKQYGNVVSGQARYISQRMGQIGAAGGLISPKAGVSGFRTGLGQMALSARIAASSVTSALTPAAKAFGAVGAAASASGGRAVSAAQAGWGRAATTISTNVRGMANIATSNLNRMTKAALAQRSAIWETAQTNAQATRSVGAGFAVMGAVIAGVFAVSFARAAEFQTQMQNINAVLHLSTSETKNLSGQLLELSKTLPQAPAKLAEAMYEVAQAGFDAQGGMLVLKAAAKAASAGLTDTITASHGLIAIINAYGKSTSEANYISDVLFQTVKVGIITFEELSQQIGDFIGFAAAAGIKIEDIGIAMSVMTRAGIPAAEAATSMNRVIQAFVKPSKDMQVAMDANGISIAHFKDGTMSLGEAFQRLQGYTGGNVIVIQKLFREIRAARGAYAMMADGGKLLQKVTEQFGDKMKITGQTTAALQEQAKAFNYQWQITKNNFSVAAIEIGNKLLPAMTGLVKIISDLVGGWTNLPGPMKNIILLLMAVVGGIGLVAGGALMLLPRLASASAGFEAMGMSATMAKVATQRLAMGMGVFMGVIAIASAAWMIYQSMTQKAKVDTDRLTAAIGETGDILSDVAHTAIIEDMGEAGIIKAFKNLDIGANIGLDAIQGVDGAAKSLTTSLEAGLKGVAGMGSSMIGTANYTAGLTRALNGDQDALGGYLNQLKEVQSNLETAQTGGAEGLAGDISAVKNTIKIIQFVSQQRKDGVSAMVAYDDATKTGTKSAQGQAEAFRGEGAAAAQLNDQLGKMTASQTAYNKILTEVTSPADAYRDAMNGLQPLTSLTEVYTDLLEKQQTALDEQSKSQSKANNESLKSAGDKVTDAATSRRNAITAATAAQRASMAAQAKMAKAGLSASSAAQKAQLSQSTRDQKRALARQRTTNADFKKIAKVGFDEYLKALQGSGDESKVYYGDLARITAMGYGDIAKAVGDGSDESVTLAALFATQTKKQLDKVKAGYEGLAPSAKQSFNKFIAELQTREQAFAKLNDNIYKLVAKGQGALVTEILESSLDPAAQAQLINSAASQGQKGLDKLYDLLSNANTRGAAEFAVGTDTSVKIVSDVFRVFAGDIGKYANFHELYAAYKKLGGETTVTEQDFVSSLSNMGSAINTLPKGVRTVVEAQVTGAQKVENLRQKLKDFLELVHSGKSGLNFHEIGYEKSKIETAINLAVTASSTGAVSTKSMAVSADTVHLSGFQHLLVDPVTQLTGGITRYGVGGVNLPTNAVIQKPKSGLVQWAEPGTGGEAFIPLARGKRSRSLSIISEVADRFGYALLPKAADGGLRYPEQVTPMNGGGYTPGYRMGASRGPQGAGGRGSAQVSETHTFSQPVYVDKVVAHDYADFRRDMEREIAFKSFPGNHGG
jgi:TP901 family phage tail tape measure protein